MMLTSKLFHYILGAFLVLGVVFYVPIKQGMTNDPIAFGYLVQELFFRYGTAVLFCFSFILKPKRQLTLWLFPAFLIYLVVSSLIGGFQPFERHSVLNIFFWVLLYKVIYENFDFSFIKQAAFSVGLICFVNLAMCALQYNGKDFIFSNATGIVPGFMDAVFGFMKVKAFLGLLSAICFPILAIFAPIFIPCLIPMMYFGVSSASAIAIVASSMILVWKLLLKKTAILITASLLLAGWAYIILYDMPKGQFGERLKAWEATSQLAFKSNPITGNGIGSFKELGLATMQENNEPLTWSWTHNEFIQALYEIGIVGLGIIFCFINHLYSYSVACKDKILICLFATFISILIISFFHFPFHLARFSHLLAFFFAIYHARGEDLKNAI